MPGKKLRSVALILVGLILATVLSLRIFGFEPADQSPGLWLAGTKVEGPVSGWSFTDQFEEIFIQTNTPYAIPHSVTGYCAVYNGELYLFSAYYGGGTFPDARRWNQNVMRDPRVRLKIGSNLYDQTLAYIEDQALRAAVHESFINKYPQWNSPGLENVHIFQVQQP
jgi:hypothetical protein